MSAQTVDEAIAEARELRSRHIGGPCPHCGEKQRRDHTKTYRMHYDSYASGTHSAGYEAAFTGEVILCFKCETPLGRRAGFLSCPTHGFDCADDERPFADRRHRVPIEEPS